MIDTYSELRRGYFQVQDWVDGGMSPDACIKFTEGDLRLAAQLVEYAVKTKRRILVMSKFWATVGSGFLFFVVFSIVTLFFSLLLGVLMIGVYAALVSGFSGSDFARGFFFGVVVCAGYFAMVSVLKTGVDFDKVERRGL